jgi:hypothetical protein
MFAISAFIARAFTKARELLAAAERVELRPITEPEQSTRTPDDGATIRTSRRARGEVHHSAKLDADAVRAIRAEVAAGASRRAVARRYGVTEGAIRCAVNGTTWRHVA